MVGNGGAILAELPRPIVSVPEGWLPVFNVEEPMTVLLAPAPEKPVDALGLDTDLNGSEMLSSFELDEVLAE